MEANASHAGMEKTGWGYMKCTYLKTVMGNGVMIVLMKKDLGVSLLKPCQHGNVIVEQVG